MGTFRVTRIYFESFFFALASPERRENVRCANYSFASGRPIERISTRCHFFQLSVFHFLVSLRIFSPLPCRYSRTSYADDLIIMNAGRSSPKARSRLRESEIISTTRSLPCAEPTSFAVLVGSLYRIVEPQRSLRSNYPEVTKSPTHDIVRTR